MSEARRQGRETGDLTGQGQIHARVSIVASTLAPPARTKTHMPPRRIRTAQQAHIDRCAPPHTHTHKHTYGLVYHNRPVHTWYTHAPGQPPSNPEKN